MPSRVIRGGVLASDSLSRVSPEASNLFLRMLLAADDYGRMDGRAALIRSQVFPLHDVPAADVERWIVELEHADEGVDGAEHPGPIRRYEIEGKCFLAFVNWEDHRGKSKRATRSRYPIPPWISAGKIQTNENLRGDPRGPVRGDEVTRCRGVEEKKKKQKAPAALAPPPEPELPAAAHVDDDLVPGERAIARHRPLLNLLAHQPGTLGEKEHWLATEIDKLTIAAEDQQKPLRQLTIAWYQHYLRGSRDHREAPSFAERREMRRITSEMESGAA